VEKIGASARAPRSPVASAPGIAGKLARKLESSRTSISGLRTDAFVIGRPPARVCCAAIVNSLRPIASV
jgi:hypothetical protein